MPVRIKIPESGTRLEYRRYWIDSDHPAAVSFWYLRGALARPLALACFLLVALGLYLAALRWSPHARLRPPWPGVAIALVAALPVVAYAGKDTLVMAALLSVIAIGVRRGWWRQLWATVREDVTTLAQRFRERERRPLGWQRIVARLAIGGALTIVGVLLLASALRLVALLFQPLSG